VRHHEFCCCVHSPPSLTIHGGQTLLCSRPSDGRTEFIGSVRRNQKPLRWIGLDLPPRPLDAFENRSPRNSLDILQKSKEILTIFHPLGSSPHLPPNTVCIQFAHMLQGSHPLVPRTTRYSSIWPKCYKLIIHLTQMLQAIHPLGLNVQSIPPLSSNVPRNSFNFWSQMLYKVRASFH
jgi:hypothetical protein